MKNVTYLKTIFTIFGYCSISSLFLLNKKGGADILFFFLINVSFLIHILYFLILFIINLWKGQKKSFHLSINLLIIILVYIIFFFLMKYKV
jgi:hypothetical protein